MLHNNIKDDNSGDHWAVSHNSNGKVLIQLQENGEQVRVALTPEQALYMIEKLKNAIVQAPLEKM